MFSLSDHLAEIDSIAVNDDGGEQVEPSHAVVLALARAETQTASFLLAYDPAPYRNRPVNDDGDELCSIARPTVYRTLNRRHSP